jgi:serine/threonine protein kinase
VQVVYRDFKASSILLDKDFKAKLAGYGLGISNCRTDKDISSSLTKTMKISRAYAKCNVWSFGVVLLELFTGKHSKDAAFLHDEKTFVKWAKPFLLQDESRRTVCPIIDSRLSATATPLDKGAQQNLLCLLLRCLKKDAKLRPSMTQVVEELKLIKDAAAHSTTRIEFSKQAFARLQNHHPTIYPDKGEFSNQAFA